MEGARNPAVWLYSISDVQDVDIIYDYVEQMLTVGSYLEPPSALANRHFQRCVVDTIDQSPSAIE